MDDVPFLLKLAETLGIHAAAPLLAFIAAGVLYRRNLELQRKLFKLAHAQVLALTKMEATLETTVQALRAARDARSAGVRDRDRARSEDEGEPFDS